MNVPVKLEVQYLDDSGFGVAHYRPSAAAKLRTVRVKAALAQEQVEARILKKRRGELFAETLAVGRSAPSRRPAPCAHYPRCGGCALQHLAPQHQIRFKQDLLLDALRRERVAYDELVQPVLGPKLGYRRKARLGARQLRSGLALGFRESFSSRVARLDACLMLDPRLGSLLTPLRECLDRTSIAAHIPQVEVAAGDTEIQLALRHLQPFDAADIDRLREFADRHNVQLLLQPGGPDSLSTLAGQTPPPLSYALPEFGLCLRFGALDFTQVNADMNRRLVADVVARITARVPRGEGVTDLFCGVGNFSLALARAGYRVLGVEGAHASVARARANAQYNGLGSECEFVAADLYAPGVRLPPRACTAMLLDPPKSGAGPELGAWVQAQPELRLLAYVSCNPRSFAQDAAVLASEGLHLRQVGIYDMFPQTTHVETLGVFTRSW